MFLKKCIFYTSIISSISSLHSQSTLFLSSSSPAYESQISSVNPNNPKEMYDLTIKTCKRFQGSVQLIHGIFRGLFLQEPVLKNPLFQFIFNALSTEIEHTCTHKKTKHCPTLQSPQQLFKILISYGSALQANNSHSKDFNKEAKIFLDSWNNYLPEINNYIRDFKNLTSQEIQKANSQKLISDSNTYRSGCNNMLTGTFSELAEFHINMTQKFHLDPYANELSKKKYLVKKLKKVKKIPHHLSTWNHNS